MIVATAIIKWFRIKVYDLWEDLFSCLRGNQRAVASKLKLSDDKKPSVNEARAPMSVTKKSKKD